MFSTLSFKSAFRQLVRTPSFTIPVVLMLALALGANATILSVLVSVLFRPLPYESPNQLAAIWQKNNRGGQIQVSGPDFVDWRSRSSSFNYLAAVSNGKADLMVGGVSRHVGMAAVSQDFFRMMGVPAQYGRWPTAEEHLPGTSPVFLISHRLWAEEFGSDPQVVGRTATLDGFNAVIVGILPSGFEMPGEDQVDVYVPLEPFTDLARESRSAHNFRVFGRLAAGISLRRANDNLQAVAAQLAQEYPSDDRGLSAQAVLLRDQLVGNSKYILWLLFGAASAVLLISAANLASLNLARHASRRRELVMRLALGARLKDVLAPAAFEAALLTLLGTLCSLVLTRTILAFLTHGNIAWFRSISAQLNGSVIIYTLALGLLSGLVFSMFPAWLEYRRIGHGGLQQRDVTFSSQQTKTIQALVVVQLTATLVLFLAGGDLLLSMMHVLRRNPGFESENRAVLTVFLPRPQYDSHDVQMHFYDEVLREVQEIPEVESAGIVNKLPFSGAWTNSQFEIASDPGSSPAQAEPSADYRTVTDGYFHAMDIPILRGRAFNNTDTKDSAPVAIISASLADRYFKGKDPIGQYIRISSYDDDAPWRIIVGVAGDILHDSLEAASHPTNYIPVAQTKNPIFTRSLFVVAHVRVPTHIDRQMKEAITRVDKTAAFELHQLSDLLANTTSERAFSTYLILAYAALGVVLTIVGIIGMMSFVVSRRRSEIGIRMALGASRGRICGLVLRQSLRTASIGLVMGMLLGLAVLRLLQTQVFGISVYNPSVLVGTPIVLILLAVLASAGPAIRASNLDVSKVIQGE